MNINKPRHITRDFNMSLHRNIHYGEDYWLLEILRFNHKYEKIFAKSENNVKTSNAEIGKWKAWTSSYVSKNNKSFSLSFEYDALVEGDYRIECLYSTTSQTKSLQVPLSVSIFVDDEVVKNDHDWITYEQYHSRNLKTVHLSKGKHGVNYKFPSTVIVLGFVVKLIESYKGDNQNSEVLTVKDFDFKQANDLSVDELNISIQYWHGLDDDDSRSGYIFDWRDEVNFWIRSPIDGELKQMFGGYVSTVTVDADLTKMTINCAGRLVDLDKRYVYPEYVLLGGSESLKQYQLGNTYYDLESYTQVMQHLLTHPEVSLQTNIKDAGSIEDTSFTKNPQVMFYGSKKKKVRSTSNVSTNEYDDSIELRNGKKTNITQSVCLWKDDGKDYLINSTPTFYIQYGMGEPVSETKNDSSTATDTSEYLSGLPKISNNVSKQAKSITSSKSISGVKDIWRWISYKFSGGFGQSGFYQTPTTSLKRLTGNCCCRTELLFEMCQAVGVFDSGAIKGYYYHGKKGSKGHVYAVFKYKDSNGKSVNQIVDPSTRNGWGKVASGWDLPIVNKTLYPTKPF